MASSTPTVVSITNKQQFICVFSLDVAKPCLRCWNFKKIVIYNDKTKLFVCTFWKVSLQMIFLHVFVSEAAVQWGGKEQGNYTGSLLHGMIDHTPFLLRLHWKFLPQ